MHDWWMSFESRHLWTARLIVYFTCLAVVVLVCCILFRYFNLFHTDADSARYMLSALVQTQSAIVAIVITLTLIAVQLTASAYSPRVIEIFKKNPDMWLLLGCYGVSIFYGFIVLKLVEGAEGGFISQSVIWSLGCVSISFESYVSLAYWLGAFTFVALFPYMWNIIGLLKSETIVNLLAKEITKDKFLKEEQLKRRGKDRLKEILEENPLQPIMDIIHSSIMKYDLETTRIGLTEVTKRVIEIIDSDIEEKISMRFCEEYLRQAGRLAARGMEDDELTLMVINSLENFGVSTAGKRLEHATKKVAWVLEEVGEVAAEKGKLLEKAVWQAAKSLVEVGRIAAVKKGLEDAISRVACSLAKLTISSEEIVKTAIQDYESDLEEKDRGAFKEFMNIYEQKLEELRAENQKKKTESR